MFSSTKRRSAAIASVLAIGGTLLMGAPAQAATVDCFTSVSGGRAYATCTVYSGQVRVRADCAAAPDLYSPWSGVGTWNMSTAPCPWGISGAILETRY